MELYFLLVESSLKKCIIVSLVDFQFLYSSKDFEKIISCRTRHFSCFFIGLNESSHRGLSNRVFCF